MQAGTIHVLSDSINLGTPYVLTSPNAIIYLPDDTQVSGLATVSPLEAVSANPHVFSYLYIPTMGGPHTGYFEFLYGADTLNQTFSFWVCWTNIYKEIRTLLGQTKTSLPDERIDLEFQFIYNTFLDMTNNALPLYQDFTAIYKIYFDLGMTKLIAAKLRPYLPGVPPSGEVILFKKGTTTVQYSVNSPKRHQTIEEVWWEEGIALICQYVTELAGIINSIRVNDDTMTRGPLALGNTHSTGNWTVDDRGGNSGNSSGSEM